VPGSGLGLAIARGLARSSGGELRLAPPEDGGATFVLTLPATEADPRA
jgi:signal transduction histidine kinase